MNILSHYLLANQEEYLYKFGAILPDFLKRIHLKVPHLFIKTKFPSSITEINSGVKFHYEIDAWFHLDDKFLNHQHNILQLVHKNIPDLEKAILIGHIATELLIDHLYLSENESIIIEFNDFIVNLDHYKIQQWMIEIGFEKESKTFKDVYLEFASQNILEKYKSFTFVTEIIIRIYKQVYNLDLSDKKEILNEILIEYVPYLKNDINYFLNNNKFS